MDWGKVNFFGGLAILAAVVVAAGIFGWQLAHKQEQQMESLSGVSWIIPLGTYDKVFPVKNAAELYIAKQGDRMALVTEKEPCTAFRYRRMSTVMENGLIAACDSEGRYGFIDEKGREQVPFLYEHADSFKGNYAAVKKGGMNMVIDKSGKVFYQLEHAGILERTEKEGVFLLSGDEDPRYIQLIDIHGGKELLPPAVYDMAEYSEGCWLLRKEADLTYSLVDDRFDSILENVEDMISGFGQGLAGVVVDENGKLNHAGSCFGYADKGGNLILGPYPYYGGTGFHEDRACLYSDDGIALINRAGKVIKDVKGAEQEPAMGDMTGGYDAAFYANGYMPLSKEGAYGFVDKNGDWGIQPVFSSVSNFSEGRAAVVFAGNWGIIGKEAADVF